MFYLFSSDLICSSLMISGSGYTDSTASFLFSLKNNLNQQCKMFMYSTRHYYRYNYYAGYRYRYRSYRYYQYAIYSNNGDGPTFGNGHDLYISNSCHTNTNSYSDLGRSYRAPNGYGHGSSQARNFLAGSYNFKCDEYEVFYQV